MNLGAVVSDPTYALRDLYKKLKRDAQRDKLPFSADIVDANNVILHPFSTLPEKQKALAYWLQRHQPCLFGRAAAANAWLHYCIVTEDDLTQSDQHVAGLIREGLLAWKQRSVRPTKEFSHPAHGFFLLVASERVALAAPAENLKAFAEAFLTLWPCQAESNETGVVNLETLYLRHPVEKTYVRFTFSIDFFAAQGDGRWWQDHRVPGGIAFTANSAGHMRRYREWYTGAEDQKDWLLQTAMLTIDRAADTPFGKATWLKPLAQDGTPIVSGRCPFRDPTTLKQPLRDRDWTRYGGHLHTDHSIREEFFRADLEGGLDPKPEEWLADFTYLYDGTTKDHLRFVHGELVAEAAVFAEIGDPESYTSVIGPRRPRDVAARRTSLHEKQITELLASCAQWALTEEEKTTILIP